jgi:ribonuclease HII
MLPLTLDGLDDDGICAYIDECGRGCFAGPVCAAVVVWPKDFDSSVLNAEERKLYESVKDSKKISENKRVKIADFIKTHAKAYAIACVDNEEIDKINILQATFKAMHMALNEIENSPHTSISHIDHIFVDGNRFKTYIGKDQEYVPHTCIIEGDAKLFQIAAASILAKTYRDKYITDLGNSSDELKVYKWDKNKGYGTKEHTDAIKKYGMTQYHRKTFIHF